MMFVGLFYDFIAYTVMLFSKIDLPRSVAYRGVTKNFDLHFTLNCIPASWSCVKNVHEMPLWLLERTGDATPRYDVYKRISFPWYTK
jgi:hypothetical protein